MFCAEEISRTSDLEIAHGELHPPSISGGFSECLQPLSRDFGESIVNPHSSRFPIDTHFHDATLGRLDIPYATSRGLSAKGRYEDFLRVGQQGHRLTQQRLGEEMPITSWMGGIWYGHQQRKVETNPSSLSARRASVTKIDRTLNKIQSSGAKHLLPETYGLEPVNVKIDVGQGAR